MKKKMKYYFNIILMMLVCQAFSQNNLKTTFYNIEFPESSKFKLFNSVNEEFSNIDVYKVTEKDNEELKYLIYLMSNSLNKDAEILNKDNLDGYLNDIGDYSLIKVNEIIGSDNKTIEATIRINEKMLGIIFLNKKRDILNRIFFMIPQVNYSKYLTEINDSFKTIKYNKNNWKNKD